MLKVEHGKNFITTGPGNVTAVFLFSLYSCPAIAAGNAMHCATGFIDDSSDATSFVSLSAEFVIAAKRGSNTLYFRAEYDDACPLGTENPCYDIEVSI